MIRKATPWLLAAVVAILALGCKPKVGGKCKIETKEACTDKKAALACHEGKWEEMQCRGPLGCATTGGEASCDQSVAEDKDVCNLADDVICTSDKKAMLECKKNHWVLTQKCLGANACTVDKKIVKCDNSFANLGDACTEENDYACTVDKKGSLVCKGDCKSGGTCKFTNSGFCKGPKGCRVSGDKIECDDSIAALGDPCDHEGNFACNVDSKSILQCKSGKFAQDDPCKGKEKCKVVGDKVGCY
jgi:hypothetical protein